MADLLLSLPTGEVSLLAGVAKTVLTFKAPANQRLKLRAFEILFKDTVNTDSPVKIELSRITTDGGTATTLTPAALDESKAETPQGTYRANYTVEPTTYGALVRMWEIHPQTGVIVPLPMTQEILVKGGNIFGIRMTAVQAQTVAVNGLSEE
jgi:hypothetical protein